jgi:hypothetical protein
VLSDRLTINKFYRCTCQTQNLSSAAWSFRIKEIEYFAAERPHQQRRSSRNSFVLEESNIQHERTFHEEIMYVHSFPVYAAKGENNAATHLFTFWMASACYYSKYALASSAPAPASMLHLTSEYLHRSTEILAACAANGGQTYPRRSPQRSLHAGKPTLSISSGQQCTEKVRQVCAYHRSLRFTKVETFEASSSSHKLGTSWSVRGLLSCDVEFFAFCFVCRCDI